MAAVRLRSLTPNPNQGYTKMPESQFDPMAELYESAASDIAAMLKCANLEYTGPAILPHGVRTEITKSHDGKVRLYADATPAIFYSLSTDDVTLQTGTGDDMLELLITILKASEEDMVNFYPSDRIEF